MYLNTRSELTSFPHDGRVFPSASRIFLYLLHLESLGAAFGFPDLKLNLFAFLGDLAADDFGMNVVFPPVFTLDETEFTFGVKEYDLSLWHNPVLKRCYAKTAGLRISRRINASENYCKIIFLLLCPCALLTFKTYKPLLSSLMWSVCCIACTFSEYTSSPFIA